VVVISLTGFRLRSGTVRISSKVHAPRRGILLACRSRERRRTLLRPGACGVVGAQGNRHHPVVRCQNIDTSVDRYRAGALYRRQTVEITLKRPSSYAPSAL
jgi:hypothetical protein